MKNKYKVITYTQLEQAFQIVIDRVTSGKPSYTKRDVLTLINLIYNTLLKEATRNAENGMYIQEVIDEHAN